MAYEILFKGRESIDMTKFYFIMIDKYFLDTDLELTTELGHAIVFKELDEAKKLATAIEDSVLIEVEANFRKVDLDEF